MGIRWPQKAKNKNVEVSTGTNKIKDEIRTRYWNWTGDVLRKYKNNDCMVAKKWQPEDRCPAGWPKTTWRRHRGKRRREGWNSWNAVQGLAAERTDWKTRAAALCASWWWLSTAVASSTSSLSSSGQLSATLSGCFFVWSQLQGS